MRPANSWPMVKGICSPVAGCGRSGVDIPQGPIVCESEARQGGSVFTIFVLVEIAATDAAPFNSDKCFMFLRLRFRHVHDANITSGKELCCFHGV